MRTYLYLLYAESGELAGLESGVEANDRSAAASANRMLGVDSATRCVEVWRDGQLVDHAGGCA